LVRTDTGEVLTSVEASVHVEERDRLPDQLEAKLKDMLISDAVRGYFAKLGLPTP
jgi:hypothetical protein